AAAGLALAGLMVYARGGMRWLRAMWGRWTQARLVVRLAGVVGGLLVAAAGGWLLVKQTNQITHGNGSLFESRGQFWAAALDQFPSRPVVGVGPDLSPWLYARYASIPPDFFAPHAHSLIFQILSGSGLLGLAALLLLGGAAAVLLWRKWRAAGSSFEIACL